MHADAEPEISGLAQGHAIFRPTLPQVITGAVGPSGAAVILLSQCFVSAWH
jgi:hypothetical protein